MTDLPDGLVALGTFLGSLLLGGAGYGGHLIYNRKNSGNDDDCRKHCKHHGEIVTEQVEIKKTQAVQGVEVSYLKEGFVRLENKMDAQHQETKSDLRFISGALRKMNGGGKDG